MFLLFSIAMFSDEHVNLQIIWSKKRETETFVNLCFIIFMFLKRLTYRQTEKKKKGGGGGTGNGTHKIKTESA